MKLVKSILWIKGGSNEQAKHMAEEIINKLHVTFPNATIHRGTTGIQRYRWGGMISGIFVSDFHTGAIGLRRLPSSV
jgi:hypothetical protein